MNLDLDSIKIDAGTQSRAEIKEATITEYADAMLEGSAFPPAVVFFDGIDYILADGFHRYFAVKRIKVPSLECTVKEGTARDAKLYSFQANFDHGLPRTAADKRKAVTTMLEDSEWKNWSDREIARQCKVSAPLVGSLRKSLGVEKDETTFKRNDKVVSRLEAKKEEPEEEFDAAFDDDAVEQETRAAAVESLQRENEDLQDKLTAAMAGSQDDLNREMAESVIKDLRAQIKMLELEMKEVKLSRDTFIRENAELKKQILSSQKKKS